MKIKEIKEFVDSKTGIDISTKKRNRDYVDARFIFVELCYRHAKEYLSLSKVGYIINRDHASVIHSQKMFKQLYKFDRIFTVKFDKLEQELLNHKELPEVVIADNVDLIQLVIKLTEEKELLKRNNNNLLERNFEMDRELKSYRERFRKYFVG